MEQGRVAAHHAAEPLHESSICTVGIYIIPDIASWTDRESLTTPTALRWASRVTVNWPAADHRRFLRVPSPWWRWTHSLLGVHVFGTGGPNWSTSHAVMGFWRHRQLSSSTPSSTTPRLAEAYKVAALDAMNKMRQIARFS